MLLCKVLMNQPFEGKFTFLKQQLLSSYSDDDIRIHDITQKIANIQHNFKQKWLAARKTAEITKIDKELIYRLKVILDTMCCEYKINVEAFQRYCDETAEMYVALYGFYPMSPTLHKVLLHGAEVIKHAILPIGQLSEEAAEARNKHIRQYRLNYSRKFSRVECNMDVLNRLLLTSDPLLTSMRSNLYFKKNRKTLYGDVLNLVSESDLTNENVCSRDE